MGSQNQRWDALSIGSTYILVLGLLNVEDFLDSKSHGLSGPHGVRDFSEPAVFNSAVRQFGGHFSNKVHVPFESTERENTGSSKSKKDPTEREKKKKEKERRRKEKGTATWFNFQGPSALPAAMTKRLDGSKFFSFLAPAQTSKTRF